jgi:hypothetical protein
MKGAFKAMQPVCTSVGAAVKFAGWDEDGIVFEFTNPDYAAEFRQLNAQLVKG